MLQMKQEALQLRMDAAIGRAPNLTNDDIVVRKLRCKCTRCSLSAYFHLPPNTPSL